MKYRITFLFLTFLFCSRPLLADIGIEPVVTGLTSAVAITHAGDSSNRLFITQQNGRVLILDNNALLPTPFLNIGGSGADRIISSGEQGLLSIAFHPSYASNGFFFTNYTRKIDGATVIARYSVSGGDANIADPDSELVLLVIPQPYSNHNGGQLQFGKDGYLYIGMGDGGSSGDPENNAQNTQSLLGKMLRIDVDHGSPYAIPTDNPFVGNNKVLPEIWAIGYRNPWRFSFDRLTGDMWVADVGQDHWEEVDHEKAGDGGRNYGWRKTEGDHCYYPFLHCNKTKFTKPVIQYEHINTEAGYRCSIIGGYVYRGTALPSLQGLYLYADWCTGEIWSARQSKAGGPWNSIRLLDADDYGLNSFGEDEAGEIYVVYSDGIYKFVNLPATTEIYSDDFEDNDVSDWSHISGTWQVNAGELSNTTKKTSRVYSRPYPYGYPYAFCTLCKIETAITPNSKNAVSSLLIETWGGAEDIEVQLNAKKNQLSLMVTGYNRVAVKEKIPYVIDPGQTYDISLRYNGAQFLLWVNNTPTLSLTATVASFERIEFQVKNGISKFAFIKVSE